MFNRLSAWLTVVANPDPSTMKRRKLTAAHIDTYWLLGQSSLRLGTCPECVEMLREHFLSAEKNT